jgi:centrosomal protein CEP120
MDIFKRLLQIALRRDYILIIKIIYYCLKNGLERKLEACIKSKSHYKEQWIKALQEIGNLKKREEENSKAFLKKQQIELDHLRMKYLAAEENSLARSEEKQLESLRSELSKYK